ncbi:MAG TPA: hypothetical protein VMV94_11285, partial [Phycisphaerae bacterium]|nr:hypothetical protein [Phycisphaerae bacterium]
DHRLQQATTERELIGVHEMLLSVLIQHRLLHGPEAWPHKAGGMGLRRFVFRPPAMSTITLRRSESRSQQGLKAAGEAC